MCEYCEKNTSIKVKEPLGICIHYPNRLVARGIDKKGWDISIDVKINYCPICGKKLIENEIDIDSIEEASNECIKQYFENKAKEVE